MLLHLQILSTMSNSKVITDSCILVLTGANYMSWRPAMKASKSAFLASLKKEEYVIQYQVHKTIRALEAQQKKPKEKTPEELVPKEYHKFLKVFSKKEFKHMLLWKP